jgi:citrate lyase subunit beta/citryl-CoA lyase
MRRSMLFLPGNTPRFINNADVLGADSVILDLEDAVSPEQKDTARLMVRNALHYKNFHGVEVIVRVNPISSGMWQADLDEIVPFKPSLIMPTKVDSAEYVKKISDYIGKVEQKNNIKEDTVKMIPLIETAMGIENAFAIATADPRVKALFIGCEDLTSDLHSIRTKESAEVYYYRCRIVCAARAAGIDVYDTPFTDFNDDEGLRKDAMLAKGLGFTGKACISPRQVDIVNEVFSPTEAEIEYAKQVFQVMAEAKASGRGAVALKGKMIDKPIVDRAARVLEVAKALGKYGETNE